MYTQLYASTQICTDVLAFAFSLMTGGSCFTAWEAMLSEAEKEAKSQVELAQKLSQSIASQLSEITARKRNLKKKVHS